MRGRVVALAGLAAVAALGGCKKNPADDGAPGYTDLPAGFFNRPIHLPPAAWTVDGAKRLTIVVRGPIRLVVTPEDRTDIKLMAHGVEVPADKDADGRMLIGSDGKAPCPMTAPPAETITLRTPRDIALHIDGPAWGEVGATRNLILEVNGCGRWTVAPVEARLLLAKDGKGSVEAARAGEAWARLSGGEAKIGALDHGLDAYLQGGALTVQTLDGNLAAEVRGDGRLEVNAGITARVELFAKGSGHIFLRGDMGGGTAEAYGLSKIRVARMLGNATTTGDVEIGLKNAPISGF